MKTSDVKFQRERVLRTHTRVTRLFTVSRKVFRQSSLSYPFLFLCSSSALDLHLAIDITCLSFTM